MHIFNDLFYMEETVKSKGKKEPLTLALKVNDKKSMLELFLFNEQIYNEKLTVQIKGRTFYLNFQ